MRVLSPCSVLRLRPAFTALALLIGNAATADDLFGQWRVVDQRPAPWVEEGALLSPASLDIGTTVDLGLFGVAGPQVLACTGTGVARLTQPAQGLFQGGLTDPVRDAEWLGFRAGDISTLRIDCDNASWDFHRVDTDTLLFALDNRIYSLSRTAGTMAAPDSPEAAAQRLLEQHFDGEMAFISEAWSAKRVALSPALNAAVDGYFSADWPQDEPPPINGDPLTDSQEYPNRFVVRAARVTGNSARVLVDFSDAHVERSVTLLMVREAGRWLLDDIDAGRGESLVAVLNERP